MRCPAAALLLLTGACASSLSTLQTARPLEPGQVEVSGALGLLLPTGPLLTVADEGIDQSRAAIRAIRGDEPFALSEAAAQSLLSAGLSLAVASPGLVNELGVRVGVVEDLDLGLRYGGTSLRLDAKYRLHHAGGEAGGAPSGRSFDVALGLGAARHLFEGLLFDALEVVQVDAFSRWDVEVPLYVSWELGEVLKVYGAAKYIYSRIHLDERLRDFAAQGEQVSGFDVALPARVGSHFGGATGGLALGYRYVHLYVELTGGYTACRPVLFGRQRNLGGVTLYPVVGLALRTPAPRRRTPAPVGQGAPPRPAGRRPALPSPRALW